MFEGLLSYLLITTFLGMKLAIIKAIKDKTNINTYASLELKIEDNFVTCVAVTFPFPLDNCDMCEVD